MKYLEMVAIWIARTTLLPPNAFLRKIITGEKSNQKELIILFFLVWLIVNHNTLYAISIA